jgi:hypothetical protein
LYSLQKVILTGFKKFPLANTSFNICEVSFLVRALNDLGQLVVKETELNFKIKININFPTFWMNEIAISFLSFKDISGHGPSTKHTKVDPLLWDESSTPTKVDRRFKDSLNSLSELIQIEFQRQKVRVDFSSSESNIPGDYSLH